MTKQKAIYALRASGAALLKGVQAAALKIAQVQTLIGLGLLGCGLGAMFRPAVGVVAVGALLVLEEVVGNIRGRQG